MDWLTHLIHAFVWFGAILVIFAIIGFIATIRWIAGLFRRGEAAAEGAARSMGDSLHRR
jgi:hypothetical protein